MAKGRGRKTKKSGSQSAVGRLASGVVSFFFGKPMEDTTMARFQEIKGLCLIAAAVWLLLSLVSFYAPIDDAAARGRNWGGQIGFWLANGTLVFVGLAGYLVVALSFAWGVVIVARKRVVFPALRLFGALCFVLSVAFMLQLGTGPTLDAEGFPVYPEDYRWVTAEVPYGPGGWLALQATEHLVLKFGGVGLWVILALSSIVSFMIATEMAFYPAFSALGEWLEERRESGDEDWLTAVSGWTKRLLVGLWDFLRGGIFFGNFNPSEPRIIEQLVYPPNLTKQC